MNTNVFTLSEALCLELNFWKEVQCSLLKGNHCMDVTSDDVLPSAA